MPRYQVTICPDCSATLGAGGTAHITTHETGLSCVHQTVVNYDDRGSGTACLLTIIGLRPQSMQPEIRTVHLTQADLDVIMKNRGLTSPVEWLHACHIIDLDAAYGEDEFSKPESD